MTDQIEVPPEDLAVRMRESGLGAAVDKDGNVHIAPDQDQANRMATAAGGAPVWKPLTVDTLPAGRPVLLRAPNVPFGAIAHDRNATIHIGQRGNGQRQGLWTAQMFWPFANVKPGEHGAEEFTHFAEIPAFDGEGA